ncbi:hypothetical protein ES695_09840 [Candidatus Atribacteria bacterium 1244-E10-H5-B2]|nr:MAG: hypothetical protein ES695_09840 [Candidatus Atribacteria bacterium 1244-E10-H5-B2]
MTENSKLDVIGIIADDVTLVPYRPKLNKITGSVLSTIILQQVLYWWKKGGRKKFYKFKDKCNHALYSEGDSWLEELCFTREEFDTAIKRIGFKMGKTRNKIKKEEAFIIYYQDKQGVTWYDINADYLTEKLTSLFLVKWESHVTKKSGNPTLLLNTKTTADIKEQELTKYGSLKKELKKLNFSDQEVERLLKAYTPEQVKNKLKALGNRQGIRNCKAYLLKILKVDYPNKNMPVISDNGGNGDSSDDFYPRYIPKKDDRTPEELKRDRLKIAELARIALERIRGYPGCQVASS